MRLAEQSSNSIEVQRRLLPSNLMEKVFLWLTKQFWEEENRTSRFMIGKKKWYFKWIGNTHELKREVKDSFEMYYRAEKEWAFFQEVWSDETKEIYEKVVHLLIISDVARLITAWDWQVDRTTVAEDNLGLIPWWHHILQKLVEENIWEPTSLHTQLHKGQWNGASLLSLIKKRKQEMAEWSIKEDTWIEKWISDRLYFPLEDIILTHILEPFKTNPTVKNFVINILCPLIKKKLKAKWFTHKSSTITEWKESVPFCDVNDIYDVLEEIHVQIESEIQSRVDPAFKRMIVSRDYTDDSSIEISQDLRLWLLSFLKKNSERFRNQRRIEIKSTLQRKIKTTESNKNFLLSEDFKKDERALKKWKNILARYWLNQENTKSEIEYRLNIELGQLEEGLNLLEKWENNWDSPSVFWDFYITSLFDLFPVSFQSENTRDRPNLNKSAYLYFGWVKLGWFSEIPKLFPSEEFSMIFSSKWDSHEPDDIYKQDIKNNLLSLKKWWMYISDGVRSSFSRIYRIDVVKEVLDELNQKNRDQWIAPEYKALVALDKNNRYALLSCIIMRRSNDNLFLFDPSEVDDAESGFKWEEVFQKRVILKTVEEALKIPYFDVISHVRRKILRLTVWNWEKENVDIFRGLHKDISRLIKKTLVRFWKTQFLWESQSLAQIKQQDEFLSDSIIEKCLEDGTLTLNASELRRVYQEVKNQIRLLVLWNPHVDWILAPEWLNTLANGEMCIFPRIWIPESLTNTSLIYDVRVLPTNSEFLTLWQDTENKINIFKQRMQRLKHRLKRKPIIFLDYIDCVTNDKLLELLKREYGEDFIDEHIEVLKVTFHNNGKISNRDSLTRNLYLWKRTGGIIIWGWSWIVNTDNIYWESIKELFREINLYEAIRLPNSKARMLAICSTYQTASEVILESIYAGKWNENSPQTKSWMLKCLPLPNKILFPSHRLFWGLKKGLDFTANFLNSGQLIIPSPPRNAWFQILANDTTWTPSIVSQSTSNWKTSFLGFQFHPELVPSTDIHDLEKDILPFSSQFRSTFWYSTGEILRNYKEAIQCEWIHLHWAGRIFLIRSLYELSENI